MTTYDDAYREDKHLFGEEPDSILKEHWHLLQPADPVLDVGAGQGRNALFLARNGLPVVAIDPSAVAIEGLVALAGHEGLRLRAEQCGFESFSPEEGDFGGILLFGLIQILSREGVSQLLDRARAWIRRGGLVLVTAFTSLDDTRSRYAREWREVEPGFYTDGNDGYRSFLAPGELPTLMERFEVVHHWEGPGPEHRHGDGPPERHQLVEGVFRR